MKKLPNAPLQEVIFEVRWRLDVDEETNEEYDSGFELAAGKFWSAVEKEGFSEYRRKVPRELPDQLLNYQTVYQFRTKGDRWPLMQLGPGILTINDTEENYHWEKTYYPTIEKGLKLLSDAYNTDREYIYAKLLYIDTINANEYGFDGNWQNFVEQNLNFSFTNNFASRGRLNNLQFNQEFRLDDGSDLQLSVSSGSTKKTREPLLIWQTGVRKKQAFDYNNLLTWLTRSHDTTSELFKEFVKPELYASFKKS